MGLTDQNSLNLALSHVDSVPVEKLGGKSPLDVTDFLYHDLYEKLTAFGIHKIEKDRIILKPYLLKKYTFVGGCQNEPHRIRLKWNLVFHQKKCR